MIDLLKQILEGYPDAIVWVIAVLVVFILLAILSGVSLWGGAFAVERLRGFLKALRGQKDVALEAVDEATDSLVKEIDKATDNYIPLDADQWSKLLSAVVKGVFSGLDIVLNSPVPGAPVGEPEDIDTVLRREGTPLAER
jgi:hypothetical protein